MDFKAGLYDASGDPISSSTDLGVKIKRDSDDYFYDWNDGTFKPSGHTTISGQMTEINVAIVPGEYEKSVDASNWSGGVYTGYIEYTGTAIPKFRDAIEFVVFKGYEIHELILRFIRNAQKFSGSNMILLDDDDSTPLLTWALSQGSLAVSPPLDRGKAT